MGCREAIFVNKSTFDFPIFLLFFNAKFPIFPIFSILSFLFSYFLSNYAPGHHAVVLDLVGFILRGQLAHDCHLHVHRKTDVVLMQPPV